MLRERLFSIPVLFINWQSLSMKLIDYWRFVLISFSPSLSQFYYSYTLQRVSLSLSLTTQRRLIKIPLLYVTNQHSKWRRTRAIISIEITTNNFIYYLSFTRSGLHSAKRDLIVYFHLLLLAQLYFILFLGHSTQKRLLGRFMSAA